MLTARSDEGERNAFVVGVLFTNHDALWLL